MKIKALLRFYFKAEKIERHIDNLITKDACNPSVNIFDGAERICGLIEVKQKLCGLWRYIDGIAGGLKESEKRVLERYSAMRTGLKKLDGEEVKTIRRAVVKFMRHARRLKGFESEISIMKRYYCLL